MTFAAGTPTVDEPRTARRLPALDFNDGCINAGSAGQYDMTPGFRSVLGRLLLLFCDGSRFVRESIAAPTYRALSTIMGGEVLGDY